MVRRKTQKTLDTELIRKASKAAKEEADDLAELIADTRIRINDCRDTIKAGKGLDAMQRSFLERLAGK